MDFLSLQYKKVNINDMEILLLQAHLLPLKIVPVGGMHLAQRLHG